MDTKHKRYEVIKNEAFEHCVAYHHDSWDDKAVNIQQSHLHIKIDHFYLEINQKISINRFEFIADYASQNSFDSNSATNCDVT